MAKHHKAQLGIYTPTQKNLDAMQENGDWYACCDDKDVDLSAIMWATNEQQEWIKEHSAEAALDCTYGINNKKMPYFEATAVSHTGKIVPLFQGVGTSEMRSDFVGFARKSTNSTCIAVSTASSTKFASSTST
ncbi:hypothetical protein GcM1_029001 [Golovinomyces cichoracearum]|uniref:Uncharacterized protein n=1 Tax=Golovinomyces cichoracearum TaxID=62708 RepID=A0A420JCN7_9PEZI|nr:hypothetical protein GcM1_029001 [Golovinomyces cichoracearum]